MKGKLALAVLLASLYLFFNGCSDNNDSILNTTKRGNVKGKIIGGLFNLGAPHIKIQIEDKIAYTNDFGIFIINDIKVPYDIYISSDTLGGKYGCVYKNVNQTECWFSYSYSSLSNITAGITITNPEISRSFFTDGKNVSSIFPGNNLSIILPDYNPVTGKVCAIKYDYDSLNVISYSKFGFIDNVTVFPNNNINLTFTDSMFNYNPPEALVSGRFLNMPTNTNWSSAFFWISVSPRLNTYYTPNNEICHVDINNFSFFIPSNLIMNYYPVIHISFNDSLDYGKSVSFNYLLPKSGATNLNINLPSYTQITSPPANTFIDSNTVFTYYENYSSQIYCVTIRDSTKTICIYTNEQTINLQNLWKFGFGKLIPNSKISFSVETLGNYNSIDNYVNPDFPNLGTYKAGSPTLNYFVKP
jgi:hypothetical protein